MLCLIYGCFLLTAGQAGVLQKNLSAVMDGKNQNAKVVDYLVLPNSTLYKNSLDSQYIYLGCSSFKTFIV